MAIQFELYKSPRPKDEEDKELYHARVVNFQHISSDHLAREIQMATFASPPTRSSKAQWT